MPETSRAKKAWSGITTPLTDLPSRMARGVSEKMTRPNLNEGKLSAQLRGFAGGAVEGAGDLMSGMTSPLSLASMAAGPIAGMAGRGMRAGARFMGGPSDDALASIMRTRQPMPATMPAAHMPAEFTAMGQEAAHNIPRAQGVASNLANYQNAVPPRNIFGGGTMPRPVRGMNSADELSRVKDFRIASAKSRGETSTR